MVSGRIHGTEHGLKHAAVRGIHIEELESELEGDIDLRGFLGRRRDVPKGFTEIRVLFPRAMAWPLIRFDSAEALCLLEGYMPVTKLFA